MTFRSRSVTSPDGLVLQVREYGNPEGRPIVFIHGISQCQLVFARQTASAALAQYRLITYDLRGHGESDQPQDARRYEQGRYWADDLHAVLTQCGLVRPLLVGWSLGGRVICQYVQCHGDAALGGIHFVGSRTIATPTVQALGPSGAHLAAMCSPHLEDSIDATSRFIHACVAQPMSEVDFRFALAYNMIVSPATRAAILRWPGDFREALAGIRVPVRVTHGRRDSVVLPVAAELTASHVPGAQLVFYEEAGHTPFWEAPERFNAELAQFADAIWN